MLDPIFNIFTGIYTAVSGPGFLPIMGVAGVIIFFMFVLGNREQAMSRATWGLIGAAVLLGLPRIVTGLRSAIGAGGA